MGGGYVLDFSTDAFAVFVEESVGFDPYSRYDGSKAKVLRQIWLRESPDIVARLNLALIERWNLIQLRAGRTATEYQQYVLNVASEAFSKGVAEPRLDLETVAFLEKDFGSIDVAALPSELTAADVVAARLAEVRTALDANAPLAVIFLVGSTLEGLLMEVGLSNVALFLGCPSAPRSRGEIKPLDRWTLDELITVAAAVGIIGSDVSRHADQVRKFRNYIHPRQQLSEGFEPRIETARIAQQVLYAALKDLEALTS